MLKEYIVTATQKLYEQLENNLAQHYDHWEGWFNIHRFTTGKEMVYDYAIPELNHKNGHKYNINTCLFNFNNNHFVMNRVSGKIIELDADMFDKLQQKQFDMLPDDDLRVLYRNGILVE